MMSENAVHSSAARRTYLVMIAFTFLTFLAGEKHMEGLQVSLLVLTVALVKGHLVGDHFMGLAKVRGPWRWVVLVWLAIPAVVVGTAFMLAAR